MKKIFFLAGIFLSLHGWGQLSTVSGTGTLKHISADKVPAALLTATDTYWTISTVSTVGDVKATPGANCNSYKSGGGTIVKFKFLKGNRFEFLLYVQANTKGTNTETWTQVNGSVIFSKDAKGQQVFTTIAEKGVYRIVKNNAITTRPIPENELKGQHSNTYLWERTSFPDAPANTCLLMVDLDAHPGADINQPSAIDPSWVSKFQVPNK